MLSSTKPPCVRRSFAPNSPAAAPQATCLCPVGRTPSRRSDSLNVKGRPDHAIKRNPFFSLWPQPPPSPTSRLCRLVDSAREEAGWFLTCLTEGCGCNSPLLKTGVLKTMTPHSSEHPDSQHHAGACPDPRARWGTKHAAQGRLGLSPLGQDSALIAKGERHSEAAPTANAATYQLYEALQPGEGCLT